MIKIEIYRNKSSKIIGFKAVGHSENSIICNTVSVILQTGIYGVADYLNRSVEHTLDGVNGITYMKLKERPTAKTEVVLGAMLVNLLTLSKDFKEVEVWDGGKKYEF